MDIKEESSGPQMDYHLLFDINPQPMWVYLPESQVLGDVNQAALNQYGYEKAEFLSLPIQDLLAGHTVTEILDVVPLENKPEIVFTSGSYKHYKKTGEVMHMQLLSSSIHVGGQRAELVICTNVTGRETQWDALNEKYRDTQKIAQLGYWCRNMGDKIADWSEEMYAIFGRDPACFIPTDENLLECYHPDDRYLLDQYRFSELPESGYIEFTNRIITPHKEVKWVFQRLQLQIGTGGQVTGLKGIIQDITEKKRADQKFKAVFDNTTNAVVITDDQGVLIDHNQAALELFGYTSQQFREMSLNNLLNNPAERLYPRSWRRFLNGKIRAGTLDLQGKDGTAIRVSFNARPGILPGMNMCIFSDITQQFRQQQQLLASERRFKSLVQEGADLIAILDRDGTYLFASESHFKVTGHPSGYYLGKNAFDFTHPDERKPILALFSSLATNKQVKSGPFRMIDSEGNWKWLSAVATDLSGDPAIGGIVVNSKEITEDVLHLNELKLSNERFVIIMKASNEAIFDWNIKDDTVEWGVGFQDAFGYTLTAHYNHLLSENIYAEDLQAIQTQLADAIQNPDKQMLLSECRYHKANGEVIPVEYRIIFLRNDKGVAIRAIGSIRDLTKYKQSLLTIQMQNEMLRQISYEQSHVVRAPLARIMALIKLIQIYPSPENEKDELISYIYAAACELDQVIRVISDKAK
jgi:PAS domain S-box-containing protein